jgi:hypothetical protein
MWMVPSKTMCREHLLGEHSELHMFVGTLKKQRKLTGFINNNLLDIHKLWDRHLELAAEMRRRGYEHQSPLHWCNYNYLPLSEQLHRIDIEKAKETLHSRCSKCKELYDLRTVSV